MEGSALMTGRCLEARSRSQCASRARNCKRPCGRPAKAVRGPGAEPCGSWTRIPHSGYGSAREEVAGARLRRVRWGAGVVVPLLPLVRGTAAAQAGRVLPRASAGRRQSAARLALPDRGSARPLQRLERGGRGRGRGLAGRGGGRAAGRLPGRATASPPAAFREAPSPDSPLAPCPALRFGAALEGLELVEAAARALCDAGERRLDALHRQPDLVPEPVVDPAQ